MLNLEKDNLLYGTVVQQKMHANKYEKHFPKMLKDVGMAVPKTAQTRYMDGSVQRTTQVTLSLHLFFFLIERVSKLCCEITGNIFVQKIKKKKGCRDGVTCVVLCTLPSIYLVCVVFGTAIPTSFNIFGKYFSYL